MKSLNSVGLGLSLVFGCLLLALVAELYYLLWWKKRITNRDLEDGYNTSARELLYMCCWKRPSSLRSNTLNSQDLCSSGTQVHEPQAQAQLQVSSNEDFWHKQFGEEDSVEAEIMRLQKFSGPPRFLFTIKEETKEDLESEEGKSRDRSRKGSKSRSLSDLLHLVETPYLTPIASPPYFTPPLTPMRSLHRQNVFDSFFGSASEAEFNWLRSSPPPKFQFLKDAEDKLYRRKLTEDAEIIGSHKMDESDHFKRAEVPSTSMFLEDEQNGSFITLCVSKNREEELDKVQHQSVLQYTYSSQVLPLASSPQASKLTSSSKTIIHQKLHQIN